MLSHSLQTLIWNGLIYDLEEAMKHIFMIAWLCLSIAAVVMNIGTTDSPYLCAIGLMSLLVCILTWVEPFLEEEEL